LFKVKEGEEIEILGCFVKMMPKYFVRKTYEKWIKKNRKRFRFLPWIAESRKGYFKLRFFGIAPELTCCIGEDGQAGVFIHDRLGQYWDIITIFDINENRTSDGKYYCSLCEKPTYYLTRASLWEEHVFEDMLTWINKSDFDSWFCLWGTPGETSFGAILTDIRAIKREGNFENCFPVIIEKPNMPNPNNASGCQEKTTPINRSEPDSGNRSSTV
jgi:hypothetical protein